MRRVVTIPFARAKKKVYRQRQINLNPDYPADCLPSWGTESVHIGLGFFAGIRQTGDLPQVQATAKLALK